MTKKQIKKTIYIILVIFLGFLLSEIVHWLLEILVVTVMLSNGLVPVENVFLGTHCYLPLYLQFGLLVFGLIGGHLLGQAWWRIVYIEHRHWKKTKK